MNEPYLQDRQQDEPKVRRAGGLATLGVFAAGVIITGALLLAWLPGTGMVISALACLTLGFTLALVFDAVMERFHKD